MPDQFHNVRCFLPRADAGKLLTIMQQIDVWKEAANAQASRTATQDRRAPSQRPPETGKA